MSEFTEEHIEQLLPVYELLQSVQLLSPKEVNAFVKRCRGYEYRLQKNTKDPLDFVIYAEYLCDVLELIQTRRKRLKYSLKKTEIDGALKSKIANLFRRCCFRFQGRKEIWRKWLDFLKKENLRFRCSKAFFKALQIHSRDVRLREEAARWEFVNNASIDNARLHLQLGIRSDPQETALWITLFELEILNVQRLLERRKVLVGESSSKNAEDDGATSSQRAERNVNDESSQEETTNDAVLDLKLAEIVADQAMASDDITNKSKLLYDLWKTAKKCGEVGARLERLLFDRLWSEGSVCEESWFAKYERNCDNKEAEDLYELLDDAVEQFPTEKMFRFYIGVCEERLNMEDDFARVKRRNLLKAVCEKDFGTLSDCETLLELISESEEREKFLNNALSRFPSAVLLWSYLIRLKMESSESDEAEMETLFNNAEKAVSKEESLEIYELAIDYAVAHSPQQVDAVFERAILVTPVSVSSALKCIRLRYIRAAKPDDVEAFRSEYTKLCNSPPNLIEFHKTYIELEMELPEPNCDLVARAFENCISEFGNQTWQCWIDYGKYLIEFNPTELPSLYQRALASLPSTETDSFIAQWTVMKQFADGTNEEKCLRKRKLIAEDTKIDKRSLSSSE